jgi:hypothetical protein
MNRWKRKTCPGGTGGKSIKALATFAFFAVKKLRLYRF